MLSTTMAPLGQNARWINWTLEPGAHPKQKPRKVPSNPLNGHQCNPVDPANWCTYEVAKAHADASGRGLGYVFQEGDGLFFLDIDNCVEGGTWTQLAQNLMSMWGGHVAIEVSQSGTGLHVFGYASAIPVHACKNIPLGLELYHHERFVAFTDHQSFGAIDADVSSTLATLVTNFFPKTAASSDIVDWQDTGDGALKDDRELLEVMLRSSSNASTFGNKASFAELWTADEDALAKAFPSANGYDGYDRSSADSALASLLVYWCGGNMPRVEKFMRESALARDKWDDRPAYMETTIINAARIVTNRAAPRELGAPLSATVSLPGQAASPALATLGERSGTSWLGFSEQREFFAGCVYIIAQNKVWSPSVKMLLDKSRFEIIYGGHEFTLTNENKSTKSAWEAFTLNQRNQPATAIDTCFKPYLPAGALTNDGYFNIYCPEHTERTPGDAGKFLAHLSKLFPVGDDLAIMTSYMARILRSPGFKSQWWPVVQGCQGNGKTLLNLVLSYCFGAKYSHQARASALAKTGMQFNSWVMGKLYLGVEEIEVSDKRHFLEDFKDIVTNTTAAIEAKGQDQRTGDNYLNGLMLTNHRGAVPITLEDRRYAIFFTPQQHKADLERDGMGGTYFPDLYDWLYGRNAYESLGLDYGLRVVNHWLHEEAAIDVRYDPAGACQRAPETSATLDAVVESRGVLEQEIMERAKRGDLGFSGGWVSGVSLEAVLDHQRVRMAYTKRAQLMTSLGYVLHPALAEGRTHRGINGQGTRTLLWLREGHPALELSDVEAIVAAFERANQAPGNAAAQAMLGK